MKVNEQSILHGTMKSQRPDNRTPDKLINCYFFSHILHISVVLLCVCMCFVLFMPRHQKSGGVLLYPLKF